MKANTVAAAKGAAWYIGGWKIVRPRLGMWILLCLAYWLIGIFLHILPFLGWLAFSLLMPGITGGLFKAAHDWETGREPSFEHLIAAFKDPVIRNNVIILGAVGIGFNILSAALIFITIGGLGMHMLMHRAYLGLYSVVHLAVGAVFVSILLLILALLFASAMLYAIPLVMLTGTGPMEAMKLSIEACMKNVLSMTVYGLIYLLLGILTVFTLGLGLIMLMPITITSIYASFKDIFSEETRPQHMPAGAA
ncbi:MAG: BPSS1780 family membrane protein [Dissulfurimicrobium sp.]|uniref:BPSS1780 family membrane protein n=1 Tax=Dissulfurimicrobium TaxID=1769732 RepID=UPI001EDC3F3B|nr:BPSS1780 family membrane protein [Dissulfurimicrobium hydrothermale]UKL13868.1 hypothetical protein LGS26_00945 [Dissulfurimicrobium hydrothermale]